MKFRNMTKLFAVAAITAGLSQPVYAQDKDEGDWNYSASLYLWGAGIEGKLANGAEVDASFSDIIEELEFAIMGAFEARKDKWTLLADVILLDLSISDEASIPPAVAPGSGAEIEADADLSGTVYNLLGGYQLMSDQKSTVDLLFGIRYFDFDVDISGSISRIGGGQRSIEADGNQDTTDAVIGVRGTRWITDQWYFSYLFDIGTGDSDSTWQAIAGAGYRYGWGDLAFLYRHLEWEFESGEPIEEMQFSGPAVQARWNF